MSKQDNIRIVTEYLSSHNPEYVAEDVILHDYSLPEPLCGRQAVGKLLDTFFSTAFSDAKLETRHVIAGDDCVVLEATFHGVNTGDLPGHPSTGKRVELPICGVCDFTGSAIQRIRIYYDTGLLERQLGWLLIQ